MKKTLSILAVGALFAASSAFAAGTVVGTKHDLRATGGGTATGTGLTEVCVVCHTAHQASAATSQKPLWNHTGTAKTTFGTYTSATMNAAPAEIGGAAIGSQSVSLLCMGCHDATVSVLSMYNPPNANPTITVTAIANRIAANGVIISAAAVGASLTDDHPVNFAYTTALATADGGLKDPNTTAGINQYLFNGSMQCASCHDAHDNTNAPFLRTSNTGSALCLVCHNK